MTDVTVTTIDGGAALVNEQTIANLKSRFRGQLIRPTDVGYDGDEPQRATQLLKRT